MNSLCTISGHGFRSIKSVPAPSNMSNFKATTFTATSATFTWTGGTSISALTYTWTVADWKGTTITGYTITGTGTGTVLSNLPSTTFWYVQLTISNAGGSTSAVTTTGQFKGAWTFENGTTSGLINDINGGSGYNLTVNGTATITNSLSRYGSNSLYSNGGSNYVQLNYTGGSVYDLMTNGGACSVSFWIYPTSIADNSNFFIGALNIASVGGYVTINGWNGSGRQAISGASLPLNTWTHIAYTYVNNYQSVLYVNNSVISNGNFAWIYLLVNQVQFGGANCSAYYDNIYIYNRLLSSGEVSTLYSGGDVAW